MRPSTHHAISPRGTETAGLAVDVALGEVQYSNTNDGRIPIHGGQGGFEGIENVVGYGRNRTTLEPAPGIGEEIEGSRYLRSEGYPVNRGTSFLMALEYTDDGPRAQAFLTYSQSGDPESPLFDDQTKLFSEKAWRPILFTDEDIAADPELEETVLEVPRG